VVFGDLETAQRRIPAKEILQKLLGAKLWMTPRLPKGLQIPTLVAFYMSRAGVVAHARVTGTRPTNALTSNPLPGLPLQLYPFILDLDQITIPDVPTNIRPFIPNLTFITDKTHWGQALRTSPRLISPADFSTLVQAAL
jgi:hypothetical protein